jgi:chromosome segregation ATPase
VLLCELDAQIHSELKRNAELQHEIEKRDTKINELDLRINELDLRINELELQRNELELQRNELELQRNELDLQILNSVSQLEQLQLHSEHQSQHISELELRLNTIYDSASWKLMGPVRRVGRTLTADKNSDRDSTESDK